MIVFEVSLGWEKILQIDAAQTLAYNIYYYILGTCCCCCYSSHFSIDAEKGVK